MFAQENSGCKGRNGNNTRITKEKETEVIEKGVFKCDELIDGKITYKDTAGKVLYILVIQNHLYKGEWNNKTKAMKKAMPKKLSRTEEDGKLEKGILVTGKKYLYNNEGTLFKILLLQNGVILGEMPIQE